MSLEMVTEALAWNHMADRLPFDNPFRNVYADWICRPGDKIDVHLVDENRRLIHEFRNDLSGIRNFRLRVEGLGHIESQMLFERVSA